MFGHDLLHPLIEIGLQIVVVFHAVGAHERLNLGIRVPLLAVDFVAPDMKKLVGKKPSHLADECVEKLVSFLPRGVHGRIENAPLALNLIRSRPAGQFGIAHEPGRCVPRHVELGNHANAALARIRDQFPDLVLGVVQTVRTHVRQLGKFLAFNAEALVFREMPVKHVELHRGHAVQVALQNVERNKVAAHVDHQSAPGKARAVLDRNRRHGKTRARGLHQLQESLQPTHDAERGRRVQPGAGAADVQLVGFVFTQFLHGFGSGGGLE